MTKISLFSAWVIQVSGRILRVEFLLLEGSSMSNIILFSYYRSSCAYRVRIALHWKFIPFEYKAVHLVKNGGEQLKDAYLAFNPMGQVPCLVHEKKVLTQSMAIIGYLDEVFPEPMLFPQKPYEKALVMQLCETINSGIQPIQNLSVLKALEEKFDVDPQGKASWAHDWIARGFSAFERMLEQTAGDFCFGNRVTAADAFLIPQAYNALRFGIKLENYPRISRIHEACCQLPAFQKAHPDVQLDAPPVA